MSDLLWRGTAFEDQFRVLAVRSTASVQKARDLHDLGPLATILMGQMISATALLSLDLKSPESDVSLKIAGNGPLTGGLVIVTAKGTTRGYTDRPDLFFDEPQLNYSIAHSLGEGTLTVIKKLSEKSPWLGTIELVKGEIAENLAQYYMISEQIPALVNLGVLVDRNAKIHSAGGFVIQQLPQADPLMVDTLIANLTSTPNISDLMDMGMDIPEILERFLFKDHGLSLQIEREFRWECNCSRDRFRNALKMLGVDELHTLVEGIDPVCHFCGSCYPFSRQDVENIISELEDA